MLPRHGISWVSCALQNAEQGERHWIVCGDGNFRFAHYRYTRGRVGSKVVHKRASGDITLHENGTAEAACHRLDLLEDSGDEFEAILRLDLLAIRGKGSHQSSEPW